MGVSRSALTRKNVAEATDMFDRFGPHNTPPHYFVWLHQAARSLLAGESIQWCSTHGSVQADEEWCQAMTLEPLDLDGECVFVERLLVEGLDE